MKILKYLLLFALLAFCIPLPLIGWSYKDNITLLIPLIIFTFFCLMKFMVSSDNEDKYNVGF